MTFTLTEECLFCGKRRVRETGDVGEGQHKGTNKELWKTLVSVFEVREGKDPRVGSGSVVTACHECREKRTVAELIAKAREVW